MTSEEKQKFKEDLMSTGILHWRKGPALGGSEPPEGTMLLAILHGENGGLIIPDPAEYFSKDCPYGPKHWSHWARITPQSLPAELK